MIKGTKVYKVVQCINGVSLENEKETQFDATIKLCNITLTSDFNALASYAVYVDSVIVEVGSTSFTFKESDGAIVTQAYLAILNAKILDSASLELTN